MIQIIAAVADNSVIGADNTLPWQIPADLAHFKALTAGHTVVMGRKTFESIGRVLPDRENIIVSGTLKHVDGALVVPSFAAALDLASSNEIFIIGGAQLYKEALPIADVLEITRVHAAPKGDTYFPEVDWTGYEETARQFCAGNAEGVPDCTFITYRKKR